MKTRFFYIGILFLMILMSNSTFAVTEFDSADQLVLQISPQITFLSQTKQFVYEYEIKNLRGPENLDLFEVESGDGFPTHLQGPTTFKWTNGHVGHPAPNLVPPNFLGFTIVWADDTPAPDYGHLFIEDSGTLKPGQSISAQFQSGGLPGIHRFWGTGWVPPLRENDMLQFFTQKAGQKFVSLDEVPDDLYDQIPSFLPWFVDAFQGQTLTPESPKTGNLPPLNLIQRLISLKEQTVSLGWIDNQGVANSLDQKLKNTLADLQKGDTEAASGILNAFVNELDAQHGKHVNDNAFFLLKANVQFILFKLGL